MWHGSMRISTKNRHNCPSGSILTLHIIIYSLICPRVVWVKCGSTSVFIRFYALLMMLLCFVVDIRISRVSFMDTIHIRGNCKITDFKSDTGCIIYISDYHPGKLFLVDFLVYPYSAPCWTMHNNHVETWSPTRDINFHVCSGSIHLSELYL